jgi:hypothetical protein
VVVTTDRGETFHFDEIVVTAPLGWLKQYQEAFSPPLPPRFCSAIDSIGYGCLEKVCMSKTIYIDSVIWLYISFEDAEYQRYTSVSLAPSGVCLRRNRPQMVSSIQVSRTLKTSSLASLSSSPQPTPHSTLNDGSKKCSNLTLSLTHPPTPPSNTTSSVTNLVLSLPI